MNMVLVYLSIYLTIHPSIYQQQQQQQHKRRRRPAFYPAMTAPPPFVPLSLSYPLISESTIIIQEILFSSAEAPLMYETPSTILPLPLRGL